MRDEPAFQQLVGGQESRVSDNRGLTRDSQA